MSWTHEEEARYQELLKGRSPQAAPTPAWSQEDAERYAALSEKLHPTAKSVDSLDAAFSEDDSLGARLHKGVEMGGELSGVSPIYRILSSAAPYKGMGWDAAQLALTMAGAGLLKGLGVPGSAIVRGLGESAAAGGAGEALLGPEARKQGAEVEQALNSMGASSRTAQVAGNLVGAGPSIVGATLGPSVPGMAQTLAKAAATRSGDKALAAWGSDWKDTGKAVIGGPSTTALEQGRRAGAYMTPRQAASVKAMEDAGVQMTPGQAGALASAEDLNGGVARSPQLSREVMEKSRPEAARFYADQNRALSSAVDKLAEQASPGASRGASAAGSDIQRAVRTRMESAEKGMTAVSDLVKHPKANVPTKWMRHDLVKSIDDFLASPELGMVRGKTASIDKGLQKELLALRAEAASVKTLGDAARLRQRVSTQLLTLKERKGLPENVAAGFYGAVRNGMLQGIKGLGKDGEKLAKSVDKALSDYHRSFFSAEGRFAQGVAGEAGASAPATRSGSQVAETATQEAKAARLKAAIQAGTLDAKQVQSAIVAGWLENSRNASGQGYDPGKLFRHWNSMDAETKQMLGPDVVKKLDELVSRGRYTQAQDILMPNKASGGAIQAMGGIPSGLKSGAAALGRMARPGYYSYGANMYKPGVAEVASRAARLADFAKTMGQSAMVGSNTTAKTMEQNRLDYLKNKRK